MGKTIDQLQSLTTLTASDEFPVWDAEASGEEPTKKMTAQNLADGVKQLANLDSSDMIADAYSSSATYAVGDYCIHDNVLYKCNTAISTAEAWTAAHWTATDIGTELQLSAEMGKQIGNSALKPGTNELGDLLLAGYNTGSGNYFGVTIPIILNGRTITGVSCADTSVVFTNYGKIQFSNAPVVSIISYNDNFVWLEIKYQSTQSVNISVTALLYSVTITCM